MLFGVSFEAKLAAFGMKCLTVAGAFLAGWVLGLLLAMGLNRWLFKNKMPEPFKQVSKIVCALALAILVAVLIFGDGSGGGQFSGGGADGKAAGTATDLDKNKSGNPATEAPKDDKKQPAPATPIDSRPTEVTIRVTVLGGTDVRDEKFYLLDDDRSPKSLREVKDAVLARKAKETRKTVVAVLRSPPPNRVPLDHGSVTQLVTLVQNEAKLDITFPVEK
ncbi:MAG TPA: hypothetical protein VMZ71_13490 [Gemmataceae bacterium]|nr:hypothetical protein [Gemmataceae bacterium]